MPAERSWAGAGRHQRLRRDVERRPGAAGVAARILARNPELRWTEVREVLKRSVADKEAIKDIKVQVDADGGRAAKERPAP